MGVQQPVAGRLRLSMELQHRTDAVGPEGAGRVELTEQRGTLSLAYAPSSRWMFSLSAPLLRREIRYESLRSEQVMGLGDLEARVKLFIYRDTAFAPRHLLALVLGSRIPTGDVRTSGEVDPELQAGSGSFEPLGGLAYAYFGGDWSLFASEMVYAPLPGRADFRIGSSLRGTHTAQYQVVESLALRASLNFRWEAATRLQEPARDEPDSGGLIAFVAPGLLFSPFADMVFYTEVQLPAYNGLTGVHDEGAVVWFGAAYDYVL